MNARMTALITRCAEKYSTWNNKYKNTAFNQEIQHGMLYNLPTGKQLISITTKYKSMYGERGGRRPVKQVMC